MVAFAGRSSGRCSHCGMVQSGERDSCRGCGRNMAADHGPSTRRRRIVPAILRRTLFMEPSFSMPIALLYGALWCVMLVVGASFALAPLPRPQLSPTLVHQILSMANLVFHEAGHVIFSIAGSFLGTLGGSLMQVLVPAVCTLAFLTRHPDPFAAAATTWWAGQSLCDLAPYVYDARAQQLVLLGGVTGRDVPGYHDWNNLLGRLRLLEWDHTLGWAVQVSGALLVAAALAWGGYVLRVAFTRRRV